MRATGFDFSPRRRNSVTLSVPVRPPAREPDWPRWMRCIERGLRNADVSRNAHSDLMADLTVSSFLLEGLTVTHDDLRRVVGPRRHGADLRPRARVRLRNHVAILHAIVRCCGCGHRLREQDVLRWYTSISSGLSMSVLSMVNMRRITQTIERINSPQLRLQPALTEIARLHAELLSEPIFPSFNGILSRLLLTAHLARCGLPPVLFDPQQDAELRHAGPILIRLCALLFETFEVPRGGQQPVS